MFHCKFVYLYIYDFFHILDLYDTLMNPRNVCVYIYMFYVCVCVYTYVYVCMLRFKVKCEHYNVEY